MKRFLQKVLFYFATIAVVYILGIGSFFVVGKLSPMKIRAKKGVDFFVLGNSHSSCAIKDTLTIKNMSYKGETVFYSCIKAKQILKRFPEASISIEFYDQSVHSAYINLADHRLPTNYRNYMYKMNWEEHHYLLMNNPLKTIKVFLTPNILSGFRMLGEHRSHDKILDLQHLPFDHDQNHAVKTYSTEDELKNYYSLVALIASHPENSFYITRMPQSQHLKHLNSATYKACVAQLEKFKNVKLLDFSQYELKDNYFCDLEHLNKYGAAIITSKFVKKIQKQNE